MGRFFLVFGFQKIYLFLCNILVEVLNGKVSFYSAERIY